MLTVALMHELLPLITLVERYINHASYIPWHSMCHRPTEYNHSHVLYLYGHMYMNVLARTNPLALGTTYTDQEARNVESTRLRKPMEDG